MPFKNGVQLYKKINVNRYFFCIMMRMNYLQYDNSAKNERKGAFYFLNFVKNGRKRGIKARGQSVSLISYRSVVWTGSHLVGWHSARRNAL
jgi:hypothetical protein